jgi:predicted MFS family arabinose efflux permease
MGETTPGRGVVVTALGAVQILAWGTSFYFPAVLGGPIVADTGWPLSAVVAGASLGLLIAGLVSPRVGRAIARRGGRPVLATSSGLYAVGLAVIGLSPTLPVYLAGWIVLGVGMGTGLYDAAFATLTRLYGNEARSAITNLTLFGGFASTVCWPLSAFLAETCGWRGACLVYAAIHAGIALPLHLRVLRESRPSETVSTLPPGPEVDDATSRRERRLVPMLAAVLTMAAGIGSVVVVHLLMFLQARGADFNWAVMLGTLFGPAQVAARVVERLAGRHYHPIWTLVAACISMTAGLAVLFFGSGASLAAAVVVYGAGYGVSWIARGTLPLALFGPQRYPELMGRLAFPSLIGQALAPSAGAMVIDSYGMETGLATLTALAGVNVALVLVLWASTRSTARSSGGTGPAP